MVLISDILTCYHTMSSGFQLRKFWSGTYKSWWGKGESTESIEFLLHMTIFILSIRLSFQFFTNFWMRLFKSSWAGEAQESHISSPLVSRSSDSSSECLRRWDIPSIYLLLQPRAKSSRHPLWRSLVVWHLLLFLLLLPLSCALQNPAWL